MAAVPKKKKRTRTSKPPEAPTSYVGERLREAVRAGEIFDDPTLEPTLEEIVVGAPKKPDKR